MIQHRQGFHWVAEDYSVGEVVEGKVLERTRPPLADGPGRDASKKDAPVTEMLGRTIDPQFPYSIR